MAELKTYKQRVRYLLAKHPKARDSDGTLIAHYILRYHPSLVENKDTVPTLPLKNIKHLPPFENIRRSRQLIQNVDGQYLPTSIEIAKARGIKEENWRNAEVREAKQV